MTQPTWNPGIPVFVYEEGLQLPNEGTYYLVSGNGLWLHKDTGIVHGFVRVDNISVLQDLAATEQVGCRLPKLPAHQVWKIKEFFRRVVAKHHAEAGTVLYFNKDTGEYRVVIPQQTVSHGGVQYKRVALTHIEGLEGFLRVGTIHSHCDFGAFHSGTDIGDEEDFDGIHITFGHNDRERFSVTASVVVNGARMQVDPALFLEGVSADSDTANQADKHFWLEPVDETKAKEWGDEIDGWMNQVRGMSWAWDRGLDWNIIEKGDLVVWSDRINSATLKEREGEGPFKVLEIENEKLVIETRNGRARFHERLFKKHGRR